MLVVHGVIDGAENDGDIQNCVGRLCDVISRGCSSFYLSGSVPE